MEKRSLIENGDFEDSILPWRSQGLSYCNNSYEKAGDFADNRDNDDNAGCSISLSETEAHSGEKSLFVEDRTAKWAGPVAGLVLILINFDHC